jgi:transposase
MPAGAMSAPWAECLQALRVLNHAPAAARARQDRIEADAARATEAADAALRSAVALRETLERRIREVDERIRKVLAEECPPADGPASPVRLGTPTTAVGRRLPDSVGIRCPD